VEIVWWLHIQSGNLQRINMKYVTPMECNREVNLYCMWWTYPMLVYLVCW